MMSVDGVHAPWQFNIAIQEMTVRMTRWTASLTAGMIGLVLVFSFPADSSDPPAKAPVKPDDAEKPPSKEELAQWVRQLGDNDYHTREKATQLLWKAGQHAEAAIRGALDNEDPEVARRARDLYEKFKWGVYPNTPPKIAERIQRYKAGDSTAKLAIVKDLFDLGGQGCLALVKIASAEDNPDLRRQLMQQIHHDAARAIPALLAEGNLPTLDDLMELTVAGHSGPAPAGGESDASLQNYAVYWLLRGNLDGKIAHYKQLIGKKNPSAAAMLTYLYRAKGDFKNALQAANQADRPDLVQQVLLDLNDWKALAQKAEETNATGNLEALGVRAAYHRLAGNQAQFAKAIEAIKKRIEDEGADEATLWFGGKALFLNDRPEEGLAAFRKRQNLAPAVEILCAQMKFREAIKLAEQVADRVGAGRRFANPYPYLEIARARSLYAIGETGKSLEIFKKLGDAIKDRADSHWVQTLVRTEQRLGLNELAFEHAGQFLAIRQQAQSHAQILDLFFPKKGETALVWWQLMRLKQPTQQPAATLKQVGEIVSRKARQAAAADIEQWIEDGEKAAARLGAEERSRWIIALAEGALDSGKDDLARKLLEKHVDTAAGPSVALRLGDLLASSKEWAKAAERYNQAWEKDRKQPLPLYLRGHALVQAGKKEEGRKLIDLAHWLPLGDEMIRHGLAQALAERDHAEAAAKERNLLLRISQPGSYQSGDTLRQMALEAMSKKDYLQAALCTEKALLRVLDANINFVENAAHIYVPYQVYRCRAIGLVMAGKLDEARKHIEMCETLVPGGVDLAIHLVPELDKRGFQKEADKLFNKTWAHHEKWCADSPNSSIAHNDTAWLAARCRRNLDKALEHAKKSVELTPEHPGHLDTLAEVYFQRGEKDKALETIRKCIALDPRRPYFYKQLKRFETGNPAAELPDPAGQE